MSLVYLAISLILTFAIGSLLGFSHDGKLSPLGSALAFFFASMLLFLGLFGLIHLIGSWRLESNPWVVDVKEMGFWNNPMYITWLFYHDHKKWAKWNTAIFSVFAVFVVSLFGAILTFTPASPPITPENFWTGWAIATTLMLLFAFTWYQNYASVDRTPSPFPKGRLSDIPRRL
jgi:hypothetical protein